MLRLRGHSVAEAGRDLEIVQPSPQLRQGQLQQVAQDCDQSGSEYLHGWRLYHLSEQSVPGFDHPHTRRWTALCWTPSPMDCPLPCHSQFKVLLTRSAGLLAEVI